METHTRGTIRRRVLDVTEEYRLTLFTFVEEGLNVFEVVWGKEWMGWGRVWEEGGVGR